MERTATCKKFLSNFVLSESIMGYILWPNRKIVIEASNDRGIWSEIKDFILFVSRLVRYSVAPNSLSFCFCFRLSNVTNYKSAAFRSPTILNSATFSSMTNRNSSPFLTWYPVPGGHLWRKVRIRNSGHFISFRTSICGYYNLKTGRGTLEYAENN